MKTYEEEKAVTSIQRSLALLTLDEDDKNVVEHVFKNEWGPVRDLITKRGSDLSLKLVCCICSVGPPQSVIIAIKRANSRIFSMIDDKGRHPLHYLCYYGSPTYSIVNAAQFHIAALEHKDNNNKTPLEYLMTMPWEYCTEEKKDVSLELQQFHTLKCYDQKSRLPNQVAFDRWGHKVVIEEKIKYFMVCFLECARAEKSDWEGCCLSHIAEEIKEKCHEMTDEIKGSGNIIHIDAYHLVSNEFAIIVKTQYQEDCEAVYKALCLKQLGTLSHDGIFLRVGCVYYHGTVGSNTLSELFQEAKGLQNEIKRNLESPSNIVSIAMNDVSGEGKVNVSPFTESHLKNFAKKHFTPDAAVR